MDIGQTDGWMEILPRVRQNIVPFGSASQKRGWGRVVRRGNGELLVGKRGWEGWMAGGTKGVGKGHNMREWWMAGGTKGVGKGRVVDWGRCVQMGKRS